MPKLRNVISKNAIVKPKLTHETRTPCFGDVDS